MTMFDLKGDARFIAYGAMLCSAVTVGMCLLLIPVMHVKVDGFRSRVEAQMVEFRALTDDSWESMMTVRDGLRYKRQVIKSFMNVCDELRHKRHVIIDECL